MSSQQPSLTPPGLPKVRRLQAIDGQSPYNNMASLHAKIMEVLGSLPRDTLLKACRRFRQRIEAIVEAVGVFFKIALFRILIRRTCMILS